jgi:hypothetical protein
MSNIKNMKSDITVTDPQVTSVDIVTRKDDIMFVGIDFICNSIEWQLCLWKDEVNILLQGFETGACDVDAITDGDVYKVYYLDDKVNIGLSHRGGNGTLIFTREEINQLAESVKESPQ